MHKMTYFYSIESYDNIGGDPREQGRNLLQS